MATARSGYGPHSTWLWPDIRRRLREVWSADSRAECELRRDGLLRWLEAHGQAAAADIVRRDWDDFVTLYNFPAEHWIHLRTSNPIDSLFADVRLRTGVAKRMRRRENALHLVFNIAQPLGHSWRPPNRGLTVMTLLLGGARFVDGVFVPQSTAASAARRTVGFRNSGYLLGRGRKKVDIALDMPDDQAHAPSWNRGGGAIVR